VVVEEFADELVQSGGGKSGGKGEPEVFNGFSGGLAQVGDTKGGTDDVLQFIESEVTRRGVLVVSLPEVLENFTVSEDAVIPLLAVARNGGITPESVLEIGVEVVITALTASQVLLVGLFTDGGVSASASGNGSDENTEISDSGFTSRGGLQRLEVLKKGVGVGVDSGTSVAGKGSQKGVGGQTGVEAGVQAETEVAEAERRSEELTLGTSGHEQQ
jgi:hypothetical protein